MTLLRKQKTALLVLEDGSVFRGEAFAGSGEVLGEVVFNTGMTGYQEILTDPSYKGQIVTMTYPLIGNYGINPEDMESAGICLEGFIVREYSNFPSNWQSRQTLKSFLESQGKLGVEGLDCRALTRRLRVYGAMRGVLTTETSDVEALLQKVRAYPGLVGQDLVRTVTCREPYRWVEGSVANAEPGSVPEKDEHPRVVVLDCGVKYNILRCLEEGGCEVIVVPAGSSSAEILSWAPDGVLLSNGPGDPAALPYLVATVRELLGKLPIFGICLGHQILGQAVGGRTEKLKFGHHGINQPVRQIRSGRVEITSQNHGFVVSPESLPSDLEKTHENLNDGTSEGIAYPSLRAFSVQYHPEAAPGPQDASYLFNSFIEVMSSEKKRAQRNPS
ncbi:carbamoyl-phosphate synthase small subunit [Syntrophus gentianae]|uniref:Carbamoyl phosphate synthase small chain n=1 Tax=Syntrophus gentianae TaxID=43775 RepID=A0A1H7Y0U5_9BACT|nr:glutamine-hydrolyzing carbamoyl-phosphate synthase small subunit [Syntrophus gentianae]SEM39710.1 carbamoyl-phosphate synthase small subunit [Syntrophus gentianae]